MRFWGKRQAEIQPSASKDSLPSDAPIVTASEDLLGRAPFAKSLSDVIANQNTDESLIIALRGEWGSGKSSLKNLVIEDLAKRHKGSVKVLEFNPWQWGGDDNIGRAFFREIAGALGDADQTPEGRERAYEFRRYATALSPVSGTLKSASEHVPGVVGWLTSIGLLVAGLGFIAPGVAAAKVASILLIASGAITFIAKLLGLLGREKDVDKPIDLLRSSLKKRLRTLPKNLLVIVDDIDRLEPEQIRSVIRHVKANASLPKITYLLLFQREIVEKALGPVANDDGRRYLEKIVQTSFDLPAVEGARIESIVTNALQKLVGDLTDEPHIFDQTRWGNLWRGGMRSFFRNLRDSSRYLGSVGVHIDLHRGERVFEVNLVDLLGIEALRVFEPDVFDAVSHAKALLTGFDTEEAERTQLKALVEGSSAAGREGTKNLLSVLFPRMGWAFGGSSYGHEWQEEWARDRRICLARQFDRYFALRLPDGQISESEFQDFLERSSDRRRIDEAFKDLETRGLLPVLIERLDEINKRLPIANAGALLPALFDVGDQFPNTPSLFGASPYVSAWRTASWYLQGEEDHEARSKLFISALQNSTGLAVPNALIALEDERRTKGDQNDKRMLDDTDLAEAKAQWVKKLVAATSDAEALIGHSHFIEFLFSWSRFESEVEPRTWISSLIDSPQFLPKLLAALMTTSESHTMGDFVSRRRRATELRYIEPFADLDRVEEFAERLRESDLTQDERTARDAFFMALREKRASEVTTRGSTTTKSEDAD